MKRSMVPSILGWFSGSCGKLGLRTLAFDATFFRGERATIKPGPGHYKLPNLADRLVKSPAGIRFWVVLDADHFVKESFRSFLPETLTDL